MVVEIPITSPDPTSRDCPAVKYRGSAVRVHLDGETGAVDGWAGGGIHVTRERADEMLPIRASHFKRPVGSLDEQQFAVVGHPGGGTARNTSYSPGADINDVHPGAVSAIRKYRDYDRRVFRFWIYRRQVLRVGIRGVRLDRAGHLMLRGSRLGVTDDNIPGSVEFNDFLAG